jgi:hypothetical protein
MPPKKNTAVITTYGDHEVIRPENKLRKAITDKPLESGEEDPVARAERALAELSSEFGGWMEEECERLDKARQTIVACAWLPGRPDSQSPACCKNCVPPWSSGSGRAKFCDVRCSS